MDRASGLRLHRHPAAPDVDVGAHVRPDTGAYEVPVAIRQAVTTQRTRGAGAGETVASAAYLRLIWDEQRRSQPSKGFVGNPQVLRDR